MYKYDPCGIKFFLQIILRIWGPYWTIFFTNNIGYMGSLWDHFFFTNNIIYGVLIGPFFNNNKNGFRICEHDATNTDMSLLYVFFVTYLVFLCGKSLFVLYIIGMLQHGWNYGYLTWIE